jgi:hypothetical protein
VRKRDKERKKEKEVNEKGRKKIRSLCGSGRGGVFAIRNYVI